MEQGTRLGAKARVSCWSLTPTRGSCVVSMAAPAVITPLPLATVNSRKGASVVAKGVGGSVASKVVAAASAPSGPSVGTGAASVVRLSGPGWWWCSGDKRDVRGEGACAAAPGAAGRAATQAGLRCSKHTACRGEAVLPCRCVQTHPAARNRPGVRTAHAAGAPAVAGKVLADVGRADDVGRVHAVRVYQCGRYRRYCNRRRRNRRRRRLCPCQPASQPQQG